VNPIDSADWTIDSFSFCGILHLSAAKTGKPPETADERTARPDEAGSRANLRNGGSKGSSGDEGKGNATSIEPRL